MPQQLQTLEEMAYRSRYGTADAFEKLLRDEANAKAFMKISTERTIRLLKRQFGIPVCINNFDFLGTLSCA